LCGLAADADASREPPSATITSAPGKASRRAATVVPIRFSSSRAATRMVKSSTCGRGGGRGEDAVGGSLLHPIAPGGGAREQDHEREPARLGVEVVHRR